MTPPLSSVDSPPPGPPWCLGGLALAALLGVAWVATWPTPTPTTQNPLGPITVDLNHEDAQTIALLPGIGPITAAAIIADRDRHGDFDGVDDLTRVRGVGPKTVESIRRYVFAQAETTVQASEPMPDHVAARVGDRSR